MIFSSSADAVAFDRDVNLGSRTQIGDRPANPDRLAGRRSLQVEFEKAIFVNSSPTSTFFYAVGKLVKGERHAAELTDARKAEPLAVPSDLAFQADRSFRPKLSPGLLMAVRNRSVDLFRKRHIHHTNVGG